MAKFVLRDGEFQSFRAKVLLDFVSYNYKRVHYNINMRWKISSQKNFFSLLVFLKKIGGDEIFKGEHFIV